MLVTTKFPFSHSVFKILFLQTRENPGLVWKRLKEIKDFSNYRPFRYLRFRYISSLFFLITIFKKKITSSQPSVFDIKILTTHHIGEKQNNDYNEVLCVWCFTPYQQYFSYLNSTVHKSMFPRLFFFQPALNQSIILALADQS